MNNDIYECIAFKGPVLVPLSGVFPVKHIACVKIQRMWRSCYLGRPKLGDRVFIYPNLFGTVVSELDGLKVIKCIHNKNVYFFSGSGNNRYIIKKNKWLY